MKAILIDPYQKTITETEVPDFNFKELYKLMDCDMIEHVYVSDDSALLCDEEGLFKPENKKAFFALLGHPYPITGKSFMIGYDALQGEYEDFKHPMEQVEMAVSWL